MCMCKYCAMVLCYRGVVKLRKCLVVQVTKPDQEEASYLSDEVFFALKVVCKGERSRSQRHKLETP